MISTPPDMGVCSGRRDTGLFDAQVVEHRALCREHFEVRLRVDRFPAALPGQFIQVLCRPPRLVISAEASHSRGPGGELLHARLVSFASSPLLRRPFSIASLQLAGAAVELSLMGRVVGPGSAWLDLLRTGDAVNILGPLGRPFTMPPEGCAAVLVAGGIGLPPIRWFAEFLGARGVAATAIVGAQSRDLLPVALTKPPENKAVSSLCIEEFARCGILAMVTTDDGTCGLRGRVTDALVLLFDSLNARQVMVYACGPEPMLRAVARLCVERDTRCELAMERVMACGMGTCQSCVVPVRDAAAPAGWRYALCCTEGPVFPADRIAWTDQLH